MPVTLPALLDNLIWHAFTGPLLPYTIGTARARRLAPGFSPILAFAEPDQPAFDDLVPSCAPGESLYTGDWAGAIPAGWTLLEESTMFRMVWAGETPAVDEAPEAVLLRPEHATQAYDLAQLTHPGPFGLRTIELGDYFGLFAGPRLIAMVGQRMVAGQYCEVSGVCTHPDFQGRGLARRLMTKLLRHYLQRGQIPFLHVMRENPAGRFYERLGFRTCKEPVVRVVARM